MKIFIFINHNKMNHRNFPIILCQEFHNRCIRKKNKKFAQCMEEQRFALITSVDQ